MSVRELAKYESAFAIPNDYAYGWLPAYLSEHITNLEMWALVALLVGCSALAVAQDDRCLSCICQVRVLKWAAQGMLNLIRVFETTHCLQVESGCSAVGCVMDQGSLSCGPYQIKEPYWIDCGQPGGGTRCVSARMYSYSTLSTVHNVHQSSANLKISYIVQYIIVISYFIFVYVYRTSISYILSYMYRVSILNRVCIVYFVYSPKIRIN